MKISGSCFCGAVAYEAEIDENRVGICHCRDCQKFSGSAFRSLGVARPEDFAFTNGAPKYFDKTGDTGGVRRQAFCDTCGTHLASMPVDGNQAVNVVTVRIALSEQFSQLTPAAEVFCDSRVPWLRALDGTRQYARMPSA